MAKLNADKIGKNAVTCVERAIRNCALLQSEIEKKGNTMSLDGQVNVFHSYQQDKDNFLGCVPVQVKGTYKKIATDEKMQEFADVKDLKVYQKESGAIYFYVYMSEDESRIYYAMLLPYDLKRILSNSTGKKKIKITLERFPENDINEMTNVFFAFVSNKHKQSEVVFDELYTLEDLQQKGVAIESVGFDFTGVGIDKRNLDEFLTTHSFYLYAQTKGIKKYIPVEKAINIAMYRDVEAPIKIDEIVYYKKYTINSWQGRRTIRFGASYSFEIPKNPPGTIKVHISGNLSQRITDVEFLLALNSRKKMSLNGTDVEFNDFNLNDQDIIRLEKNLERLKLIKEMLDEFGVEIELDFEKIVAGDEQKINMLIEAIKSNEPIPLNVQKNEQLIMGFFDIANLSILFIGHQSEESSGKYFICGVMKPHLLKFTYELNGKQTESAGSQYLILEKEHYVKASNLDYDIIFQSLTSFGNENPHLERINMAMLEVLKAYDENMKNGLLCLAENISKWVIMNRNDPEFYEIDMLNKYQIYKRRRELTPNEIADLIFLARTCSHEDILCAAYILLGETEKARVYFDKLPVQVQEAFVEYPICKFWSIRDEIKKELEPS